MKRLQNRVAQSRWALPVTTVYALVVCLAGGLVTDGLWLQLALLLVSTMMMVELNNHYSLIRIFSRMVSCPFIVLTAVAPFLFGSLDVCLVQLSVIAFLLLVLRAYQAPSATGWVFYAFCALGVGSAVFPQLLLFVPLLWIAMAFYVQCFNARTLVASLLGLLVPYWFVAAWLLYVGDISCLGAHLLSVFRFDFPFDFSAVDFPRLLMLAFVLVLALIGSVHFVMFSYQDRIRIRMHYDMFMVLDAACFVFAIAQPRHLDMLLAMAIVFTSPLVGHFLALSHSRASNITFLLLVAATLAITGFNLLAC